jgi:hypothetical protein
MGMEKTAFQSLFVALFSSFVGIVDSVTAHIIEHCGGGKDPKINDLVFGSSVLQQTRE